MLGLILGPHLHLWQLPLVFVVGGVASFLNSLAGGGSTISLPILIEFGIPPTLANGTNRFAILMGNLSSAASLRSGGFFERGILRHLFTPVLLGSIMGGLLAVKMSDSVFRITLAMALVFVIVASNLPGDRFAPPPGIQFRPGWKVATAFFLVGFYGGLIQVGVGFILMFALARATGFDLVRINALKGAIAVLFILASTLVFVSHGLVYWPAAIVQALGGVIGGWIGGRYQVHKGEKLIRIAIQLDAGLMAFRLLWDVLRGH